MTDTPKTISKQAPQSQRPHPGAGDGADSDHKSKPKTWWRAAVEPAIMLAVLAGLRFVSWAFPAVALPVNEITDALIALGAARGVVLAKRRE